MTATDRTRHGGSWWARHPHLVALVLLAVPLVLGVLAVLGDAWRPTGDYAHTAMAVRDVPENLPLIGVAGRFGPIDNQHAHPGPAMAYALWPVTTLFGGSGTALLVATTMLHLGLLAAAVLVARRVGGTAYALMVAAVGAILVSALGAQFFLTPWNPWIPVMAFLAFLVFVHAVSAGHLAVAPWAVLVGTLCAQTHVSYMVLVHGLLAATLAVVVISAWRHWAGITWRALARPVSYSVAVAVVMWLPPLWDQLRRTGNLGWLIGRFTHPCDRRWWGDECAEPVSLGSAARALASELNLGGAWISGAEHDPATTSPSVIGLAVVLAAAVAAVVVAVRRRDRLAGTLLGVAAVATVLGLISASRILGDFYDYVIRWTWPIAAFGAVAVMWSLWREVARRWPGRPTRVVATGIGAAVVLVFVALATADALGVEPPSEADGRSVAALGEQAAPHLARPGAHLLRWYDPGGLGGVGFGLLLELERSGFDVGSDPWTRFAVGQHRVLAEESASDVLWVVTGDPAIERFRRRSDAVELAWFDPRDDAERERSELARRRIEQGLRELGRTDLLAALDGQFGVEVLIAAAAELPDELNEEVLVYKDLRLPVALFSVPPGAPLFDAG